MNTNGNEFTIFNGAPSIHLNNSGARIEEEEELQDQIRRKAEVINYLLNICRNNEFNILFLLFVILAPKRIGKCVWRFR